MVLLVPVPEILPGLIVHVPKAGKPVKGTLPVGVLQVGCVGTPTTGAEGTVGAALMVTIPEGAEVQLEALVTVKV
jgi:hypothetical protein